MLRSFRNVCMCSVPRDTGLAADATDESGAKVDEEVSLRALPGAFDVDFANRIARLETYNKHLYRPNTYLHKWWARRCGSTFRLILKSLVEDPERRDYYAPGGLEGKVILDPMMGGGTTLHEAIRLGANVIGADIDPIPVVQARTSLTQVKLSSLKVAFNQFVSDLYKRLGHYFQTECSTCTRTVDAHYTLHGLRKICACGEVVQIDQYDLRHETDREIRIWPEGWMITDSDSKPEATIKKPRLITKSEKICSVCGGSYQELL